MKAITPIISIIMLLLITLALTGSAWMFLSGYMGGKMISMEAPPGTSFCKGSKADILLINSGTDDINISTGDMILGQFQDHANVIGYWGFDEEDGNVSVDGSGNGNDGSIYGNTLMLLRMDETDGGVAYDSTSYGNNGDIYDDTVLLMHFDEGAGNPGDESSYANNGNNVGAAWSSNCISGQCLDFIDYEKDRISISDDPSLRFSRYSGTTIAAWVKPKASEETRQYIYGATHSTGNSGFGFKIDTNNMRLRLRIGDGSTGNLIDSNDNIIEFGKWQHVAVSYDNTTKSASFYINGAFAGSGTHAVDHVDYTGTKFIGSATWSNAEINGSMDEVAIYRRALTANEINSLYRARRVTFLEHQPGISGNGLEFDGIDDYVDFGDVDMLEFDWPFTASAWVKVGDLKTGANHAIVGKGGGAPLGWMITLWGDERPAFRSNSIVLAGSALSQNEWHHIVGTYDGADLVIYVDGVEDARTPIAALSQNAGNIAYVGALHGSSNYFNGSIDEVAIYNRSLSPEEIQAQYDAGKATFIERVPGRFGKTIDFNGFTYVFVPDSGGITNFDSTDSYSISVWFKSSTQFDQSISEHWETGGGYPWAIRGPYPAGGTVRFALYDGTVSSTSIAPGDYSDGKWHHLLGVKDFATDSHTIYIDGVMFGPTTDSTTASIQATSDGFTIGTRRSNNYIRAFNGLIDEFVIIDNALTPAEVSAQMTPACTCVQKTCVCGDITIVKSKGEGDFFPYMNSDTIPARGSVLMTDYSCLSDSCAYWIATPAMSFEAAVDCK